ncbi:MAG: hypothetical protein KF716_18295 [Anaerolineae bacterium]|nr:hypothetical protein [Anaerolineae bacterium]
MFRFWIPIAHGTLGPLDEVVMVVAFVFFLGMMIAPPIITWIRGKQGNPAPSEPPTQQPTESTPTKRRNSDDHYRLD